MLFFFRCFYCFIGPLLRSELAVYLYCGHFFSVSHCTFCVNSDGLYRNERDHQIRFQSPQQNLSISPILCYIYIAIDEFIILPFRIVNFEVFHLFLFRMFIGSVCVCVYVEMIIFLLVLS